MRKFIGRSVFLAILVLAVARPAAAQSGSGGYLIGSEQPLTAQQVRQLGQAGANLRHVY